MFDLVFLQLFVAYYFGEDHSDAGLQGNKLDHDLVPLPLHLVLLHFFPFLILELNYNKSGNACQLFVAVVDLGRTGLTEAVIQRSDVANFLTQPLLLHHRALTIRSET